MSKLQGSPKAGCVSRQLFVKNVSKTTVCGRVVLTVPVPGSVPRRTRVSNLGSFVHSQLSSLLILLLNLVSEVHTKGMKAQKRVFWESCWSDQVVLSKNYHSRPGSRRKSLVRKDPTEVGVGHPHHSSKLGSCLILPGNGLISHLASWGIWR